MPTVAVPAATIMLFRDAVAVPEVLMIERHASSELMPDVYVFPGGRVDAEDRALVDRLAGVEPAAVVAALGGAVDPEVALAFVVAAIRETFEEAGILLARSRGAEALIEPARVTALARHRLDVQAGRLTFRELVEDEDLELAGAHLALHARWITPEVFPYRFDTLFFAAEAPRGQRACADGVETSAHVWIAPAEALRQRREGTRRIIFPTAVNLESVTGYTSAAETVAASRRRPIVPVQPRLADVEGRQMLVISPDAGYATTAVSLDEVLP
jgi:8-oxo-dGTP pyrophosphatase MutT (NUDIX family)